MAMDKSMEMEGKALYKTLCSTLDKMQWKYNKEEDELVIRTMAVGDDLSMRLLMKIDAERQVMYLKSPMPFSIREEVRDLLGKAVLIANYSMLTGSFEYDYNDGYLAFKMVVPYMQSIISEQVCKYMILLSCNMTDKFNDKFQALAEGRMSLAEFEKFANS
ncbi:MAG: hypothetical protein J1G02_02110 [Clostridiales bacterium]|nr:hypothetical protein [Clostridiales bacterium]